MRHAARRRKRKNSTDIQRGSISYGAEPLETRRLLTAMVAQPDPVIFYGTGAGPLAPKPGHSFYASGYYAQGVLASTWANASAITPYTTNDLVMNVSPMSTNYVPCCEGAGGTLGANLLTNGITQTQTAPAPNATSPAVGDGGANDPSNNTNVVSSSAGPAPFFVYNLGTAGGATPSATGYTLSEIDLIEGHQDSNGEIYSVDVLVQPVGSTQFLSLSGGQGFSLTSVPNGSGGTILVDRGSSQMAIINSNGGQPLAQNIQAVKLVVQDPTSFLREFVVTGTATPTPSAMPSAPPLVSGNLIAGYPTVAWVGSAPAVGYTVLRSTTVNGTYSVVGSVVGQTTFSDTTAQPNSTYFYEVIANGNGDSAVSNPSAPVVTGNFGVSAYFFQSQLWQGTPAFTEILPQINYRGGPQATNFPLKQGFTPTSYSAFMTGKITTDLAGSYTFFVNTDDDGYLYVNGMLVSANPGNHVQQDPTFTQPITLTAGTSYNFVYLFNQQQGQYAFTASWQEPLANGSAGARVLIPSNRFSSNADAPPVPQQVTALPVSPSKIQVSWNLAGDQTSYAHVVQRALADASGNPVGAFATVGQVFSGPTTTGAAGSPTWGATSFVDATASPNTMYVYRVGVTAPGQALPAIWVTTPATALPADATVSLINGILAVAAGGLNDEIGVSTSGSQIIVTEGTPTLPASQIMIFTTPAASVNSLVVNGPGSGTSNLQLGALSLPGSITTGQFLNMSAGALTAGQVSLAATNNLTLNGAITTTGPVSLSADSDTDGNGTLATVAAALVLSNSNPIYVHASGLNLANKFNSGSASILYTVPVAQANAVLGATVSSGTVTVQQTSTLAASSTFTAPATVTGTVILDCPNVTLGSTGMDTSAGGADLQITAASLFAGGAINTGIRSLAFNTGNVTLGAAVNAATVNIASYAHVVLNGATMTVGGSINNAGSLIVGAGGSVTSGLLSGTGSTAVGQPAASGTVAYYRFEGIPNSAAVVTGTIIDSSGNGLNADPINSPIYSPAVPGASVPISGVADTTSMSFDGSGQRVFIADNPAFQMTHSLTLEAYVNPQAFVNGNADGNIIFRGDGRSGLDPYRLSFDGTLFFQIGNAVNQSVKISAPLPFNQWSHVAATLDDATGAMRLYINGALVASTVTTIRPFALLTGTDPGLGIGSLENGAGEYFHGMIDEVRISNVALAPSQFLNSSLKPSGAAMTVGSFTQSAITVGPTGSLTVSHAAPAVPNSTKSLNIDAGGTLDLANNALTINYGAQPDPVSTIRSYLASGFNNTAWNGTGIISSDAANNASHATAIGYADSADGLVALPANTLELKYTLYGDTGLTGTVGFTDFMRMTQHYTIASGATWATGDFNYDGAVDASDFNLLQPNYGQTLPAPVPTQTPIIAPVTPSRPTRVTTVPPPAAPLAGINGATTQSAVAVDLTTTKTKKHAANVKHPKKR